MSCMEKRHLSHRMGSMLHHRFPNGFTDLFMDETDREVSTLTDRAFRSLCVGDDAVYNDDLLYGYSPFSCHKPLVGEPHKKTHHKESKKQGQCKGNKNDAQPWKQQQQKNMSHMSSFLKALSATEESCEGLLIKNDGMTDSNGESWDKSALRSIQRELSEFSPDYHANLTDGRYKNNQHHNSGNGKSNKVGKDVAPPSGKSKIKNGKSTVKLRKLNIKNFFLHSEFSPFQTWRDSKRFSFGQEDTSNLPVDNTPKWYDLPFYKELTETHRKEALHSEVRQPCQEAAAEPPPPADSKPIPPPSPPKVLPKPTAPQAQKRCSSEGGEGSTAPWRRNRSRAKSAVPGNQPRIPAQDSYSTTVEETSLLLKNEARSVEVKAIEEVSSLASTPFSICQLMTPLIPSRQPTETSEILQSVLSPSALDLPLRPHSEAKLTPEPPVKRDSYKSLASSILFNLKDNRKRVKSRYSPPKFRTYELPESSTQSPLSDSLKLHQALSEGIASGFSTPAIFSDGLTVSSPVLESTGTPVVGLTKPDADRPLSDDYLLSNLLQTKKDSNSEENPVPLLIHSKKNKSPIAKKQNYPSLNLYKRTSPVEGDIKYLQVPVCTIAQEKIDETAETNELLPLTLNKVHSPKAPPTYTGLSPNALKVNKDRSPLISPRTVDIEGSSASVPVEKTPPNVLDKAKRQAKDIKENDFGAQSSSSKEKDASSQHMSTIDVIREAKEAIHAAKPESTEKPITENIEWRESEIDVVSEEISSGKKESSVAVNTVSSMSRNESSGTTLKDKNGTFKKAPPPVPKRTFAKSDIQLTLDKQLVPNTDKLTNGNLGELDLPTKDAHSVHNEGKLKHIFSARQNNYIKYQRYAGTDKERGDENGDQKVNARAEKDDEMVLPREVRDSENIISDLHALKELERARLGDHIIESRKSKSGGISIDEEARAKNDLISRELRNMKKGMLSMRGNTPAKRDILAKKEELSKQEAYTKIDTNVIVNKALINDNYDKAKMALEEIISERQIRRNKSAEQGAKPVIADLNGDDSCVARTKQSKKHLKDSMEAGAYTIKEADLRERLGDLRDHNHMRNILSQTEPKLGETHRSGVRVALPGMDKVDNELNTLKNKGKHVHDETIGYSNYINNNSEVGNLSSKAKQESEEIMENLIHENESKTLDAPSVPPRSKKGASRRDGRVTNELNELKNVAEEIVFDKDGICENGDVHLVKEMTRTSLRTQKFTKDALPVHSEGSLNVEMRDVVTNTNSKSNSVDNTVPCDQVLPSKQSKYENEMSSVSKSRGNENKANNLHTNMIEAREGGSIGTCPSSEVKAPETSKVKRKAPPRPDQLLISDDNETKNQAPEEYPDRAAIPDTNVDADDLNESSRHVISPLLLVNGVSVTQSPPDQGSLSSKSSYFSVESALHRNTETESNVYQSLENLIGEVEGVDDGVEDILRNSKQDSDRPEVEYYSLSDHESEPELGKKSVKYPQKEKELLPKETAIGETTTTGQSSNHELTNQTPISPSNTFSPTLGIPALFKIKDNTFSKRAQQQKILQPWSPKSNLSSSEKGEEESHHVKEHSVVSSLNETHNCGSASTANEIFIPKEILSEQTPLLLSPPNLQRDTPKKPQVGGLLTVPQEEDRYSGVSPSSEGMESLTTSTTDTAEEMGMTAEASADQTVLKVPSEHSGSTCSANDSQTGLLKPPAVLPKSEKAVLKAIKLTNRRIKKQEAQKSPQRSSENSSRHKNEKHRIDKSELKSSRSHRSGDRKHRDKEGDHRSGSSSARSGLEGTGHDSDNPPRNRTDVSRKTLGSQDSVDRVDKEAPLGVTAERKGRGSSRHTREKPEHRHYSSDRVISNVPVYKAHVGDQPMSDRPFNRSQSIDRYLGDKVERRLSADMSTTERLDPRSKRIEKSIMDEFQQRGRARDKSSKDNPPRRSHSIDAYSSDAPHSSTLSHQSSQLSRQSSHNSQLSRQSSHNSQLSRQSSIEHTIVTQSFPMTQRKLLQDPDSGQYFFVDMPVQVKTKTFFDPETGSYVQLPVQPPEGAVLQPSPMEVLTPPLVVYHGFVPVPLSPMAQNATLPAHHMEPEELRHLERSRQMHCKQGQPYLEPVYGQHDHLLGEFLGTEELDCSS